MKDYFAFTIPGQPMSWNRAYGQKTITVTDKHGQPVLNARGKPIVRAAQYKKREAELYQESVWWRAKSAKGDFKADRIIVAYDFVLARDIDCDNVMKMIHDALAKALGMNDKDFYPVVLSKQTGSKDPEVHVTVYDRWHYNVVIQGAGV